MGRKAIDRPRKALTPKAEIWVRELVPLLQDQDLSQLTLDDLSDLMGKSKSTIYSYFSTKEEIYHTSVHLVLNDISSAISTENLAVDDMEQALRFMLMSISLGIEGISIRYLEQLKDYFPDIWATIEGFTGQVRFLLEKIYEKGMEQGSFKRFNVSLLTALDHHFVLNIMTSAHTFSDQGLSLNDVVTEYLELRLSALKKD